MRTPGELTPKQQRFVEEYLIDVRRFASYVDVAAGLSGCWPWTGARDKEGYGRFHIGLSRNASRLAHRVAFGLATGDSPRVVCHSCDNPPCCNPAHLVGGTYADNNRDMVSKGRHSLVRAKGVDHGRAKLTDDDIRLIRAKYVAGGVTQYVLADAFGVSQRTIAKVVNRQGWRHVA